MNFNFKKILLFAALAVSVVACTDEDELRFEQQAIPGEKGAYVINQGNQYSGIEGTLSFIDAADYQPAHKLFSSANDQSMGMSPQDAVIYGSKLYLSMHGSNIVWAIDRETRKIIGQIETSAPQGMAAAEGALYVTNNDGYLTKIDTTALKVAGKIEVGPNPVDIEVRNGHLYVSISDGYNSAKGYANGFRLAKVALKTFEKVGDVKVGMNPYAMTQDANGNIFVVCNGNYGDVAAKVWRVAADDKATEYCEGSIAAAHGDQLYVVNSVTDWTDWQNPKTVNSTAIYNTKTNEKVSQELWGGKDFPELPTRLYINPKNGELYLLARTSNTVFTKAGVLTIFDRLGSFKKKVEVGVEPYAVAFL